LAKVFNNFTLKSTLTTLGGTPFGSLFGFGMIVSNITRYYITDTVYYGAKYINILNDQWQYITYYDFINPTYMTTFGNTPFISGSNNIWKTDQNLIVLVQYNRTDNPYYQGIFYNSKNGFIYASANKKSAVHIFDTFLNLVDSFAPTSYYPWSISVFNNNIYVGCMTSGTILVVVNKHIISTFNGCNGNDDVKSITFDQSGFMATSCTNTGKVYLYNNNLVYTGKSITIINPMSSGFDSIGRFVVVSKDRVSLYY
jgi:hypothetical protein